MTRLPTLTYSHLRRLTDAGGLYEHARGSVPRPAHGYCVDDVARALVVVLREEREELSDLRAGYLTFVLEAQSPDGRFRNRRSVDGSWSGPATVEDCWGRALWGLGTAVARGDGRQRSAALRGFERGAAWTSPHSRAVSFATLGAAAVFEVLPEHPSARAVLIAAAARLRRPGRGPSWPWPEPRLHYANAAVPEALIAAGKALSDGNLVADGLQLLDWLLQVQTRDGHLSLVPVAGWGPGDTGPCFDQQPIEAAALADACARAHAVTGDERWRDGLELCAGWFFGRNDSGVSLYDVETGGGCDGLEEHGRNANQGAESTLALLSTLQQARLLGSRTA